MLLMHIMMWKYTLFWSLQELERNYAQVLQKQIRGQALEEKYEKVTI